MPEEAGASSHKAAPYSSSTYTDTTSASSTSSSMGRGGASSPPHAHPHRPYMNGSGSSTGTGAAAAGAGSLPPPSVSTVGAGPAAAASSQQHEAGRFAAGAAAAAKSSWFTLGIICVGVACLFASQNIMSPNLTSMAEEFDFGQEERDHLLGAELSLAYSVFSIPGAMLLGLLADCGSRKTLFVGVVGLGALATLYTAYVETYDALFWLRVLSGTATNAVIPIAFSFLGDLYPPDNRSLPSTLVTAAMGVGILVGQILAGVVGPHMGWRAPFVIIALPGVVSGLLTCLYVTEPVRGQSESAVTELLQRGGSGGIGKGGSSSSEQQAAAAAAAGLLGTRKLDWNAFVAMLRIRTNMVLILQALPGTIPWGVLFAYLNDFLSQEKGLPVEQATLLVSLFGVGSAVGGIGGGLVGQVAYNRSKRLLPVVMGVSTILGVFPMLVLINATYSTTFYILAVIVPCTFLAGILANINGTNVRPLLLNVNLPETRGSAVSVANLVANLGRGIGPSIANGLMERFGGRQGAFNAIMSLWVLCGLLVFLLAFTLLEDEARVQEEMKRSTAGAAGGRARHHHHHHHHHHYSGEAVGADDGDDDDMERQGLLMTSRAGNGHHHHGLAHGQGGSDEALHHRAGHHGGGGGHIV